MIFSPLGFPEPNEGLYLENGEIGELWSKRVPDWTWHARAG